MSITLAGSGRGVGWCNVRRQFPASIGREFFRLIDNCFPLWHKLHKIFNRNTLKLSYSCMPNVKQIIDGHNKAILKKSTQPPQNQGEKTCNCRNKDSCPLQGNCVSREVIYQATVESESKTETYVGLTATDFKTRWRNHQASFNSEKSKNSTLQTHLAAKGQKRTPLQHQMEDSC